MSQLIAPTHTFVDHIPLGRRISEIMQDKGSAYTISAMSKRLDISRETLRLMLKGEREIYNYELDKIAQDLKMPVERILQSDIQVNRRQFDQFMGDFIGPEQADVLTQAFLQCAGGLTERFVALNMRGTYWSQIREEGRAHENWLEALPLAHAILDKYGEAGYLLTITNNLFITFGKRKEKAALLDLIADVQDYFDESPLQSGNICFSLGRIEEIDGNLDLALNSFYRYLEFMEKSKDVLQIFRARFNVGFMEYRRKNYQKSIDMYLRALEVVDEHGDLYFKWNFYQCFARTCIRIRDYDQAEQWLLLAEQVMASIEQKNHSYPLFEAQQYFLSALIKNDPTYAEKLVEAEQCSLNYRKIACRFVIDYCDKVGNTERKQKYAAWNRQRYTAIDMVLDEKSHDDQYLLTLVDLFIWVGWI